MLNASRNREPLRRGSGLFALLAMLAVAAPLAALTLTERVQPMSLATNAAGDIVLIPAPVPTPPTTAPPAPPAQPSRRREAAAPASTSAEATVGRPDSAAVTPATQLAPASLSGVLSDASGGVLPGVGLRLTDTMFGIVYSRVTDGNGSFSFAELPPSRYELVASLPGFASVSAVVTLGEGEKVERRLSMRVGSLEEKILVTCAAGGARLSGEDQIAAFGTRSPGPRLFPSTSLGTPREAGTDAQDAVRIMPVLVEAQAKPVRVGGQIRAPGKVKDVKPICPRGVLPRLLVGTTVRLEGTVGTDGFLHDVRPLDPRAGDETPAEFVESALEAVRQWQFSPTLLNNVPVPVIVSVTVEYRRM